MIDPNSFFPTLTKTQSPPIEKSYVLDEIFQWPQRNVHIFFLNVYVFLFFASFSLFFFCLFLMVSLGFFKKNFGFFNAL